MRISDWSSDVCSSDLQNPAVYLPDPEPHYFSSEFHRGLSWYGEFFRGAAPGQLPGEKSADYLAHPDAARRIADLLPDIPLVVPIGRASCRERVCQYV